MESDCCIDKEAERQRFRSCEARASVAGTVSLDLRNENAFGTSWTYSRDKSRLSHNESKCGSSNVIQNTFVHVIPEPCRFDVDHGWESSFVFCEKPTALLLPADHSFNRESIYPCAGGSASLPSRRSTSMDPIVSSSSTSSTTASSSSTAQHAAATSGSASKLRTDCSVEHRQSLECISQNYDTKDYACAPFFHRYKACRKEEDERRRRANGSTSSSWFG
jgi:hypothetical protein